MSSKSGIWEFLDSEQESGAHSALGYDEVSQSGPAARPLDFPAPTVYRCEKRDIRARDHRSGTIHHLKGVVVRSENDDLGRPAETAYLVKKKIAKSVYGSVRLCIVLKRIDRKDECAENRQADPFSADVEWESTDFQAAVKISEWTKLLTMRGHHLEDPIREISALQLMGNYHEHVCGTLEVLQDNDYLYTVMPYLSGGDLYGRLIESCPRRNQTENAATGSYGFDEKRARVWFRQLLLAVFHLQKKGVCHRDISLENILLDEHDRLVLIDPGMCLRVAYSDPSNYGCVTDVSAGTCRRLMIAQGQGGKLMYAAPEVIDKQETVDAFAIDLWAVGVVLFVMLVGLAPFKWAHPSDKRFAKISRGGLKDLMDSLEIPLSPEVCDLLQGFFWRDPRKRLSLAEVMEHPWVQGKQFVNISLRSQKSPKKFTFGRFERRQSGSSASQGCENLATKFRADLGRPRLVTPNF